MTVRSLRLLPENFRFELEAERGKGVGVTFDRVGLDELCAVHKQYLRNSFPRGNRFG